MGGENKRRAARVHHQIPVAYRSVGSFLSDWATNISHGGLFINTRKPLPVGTAVRVLVQIPGASFPYQLGGRVTRVSPYDNKTNMVPGMAVEFTEMDEPKRRDIEAFVARLRVEFEEA